MILISILLFLLAVHCDAHYFEIGCKNENDFRCVSSSQCIAGFELCNGFYQCEDGTDELIGCELIYHCEGYNFRCKNQRCISKLLRCDGVDDCGDLSDESSCETRNCSIEMNEYQCEHDSKCLPLFRVCDGISDCRNSTDEGSLCKQPMPPTEKCECNKCIATPKGPLCVCSLGYEVINNSRCQDINECTDGGICDQLCINLPGSYKCACQDDEYTLQPDGRSCRRKHKHFSTSPLTSVLYATKKTVNIIGGDYESSSWKYNFTKNHRDSKTILVSFDPLDFYIIRSSESLDSIQVASRYSLDNYSHSKHETSLLSVCSSFSDVQADYVTKKFYVRCWSDNNAYIKACTVDFQTCYTVYTEKYPAGFWAMVLSPHYGLMFTSIGRRANDRISYVINRSAMDGRNITALPMQFDFMVQSLAVDEEEMRLYFYNYYLRILDSVNYLGLDRKRGPATKLDSELNYKFVIAGYELFWVTEKKSMNITYCNKNTCRERKTISIGEQNPILALDTNHFYSKFTRNPHNGCNDIICSDMCVLSSDKHGNRTFKCVCDQDAVLTPDGSVCRDSTIIATVSAGTKDKKSINYFKPFVIIISRILRDEPRIERSQVSIFAETVEQLAYDSVRGKLIYWDPNELNTLVETDLHHTNFTILGFYKNVSRIIYDGYGNNIFMLQKDESSISILNLIDFQISSTFLKLPSKNATHEFRVSDFALYRPRGSVYVLLNAYTQSSQYENKSVIVQYQLANNEETHSEYMRILSPQGHLIVNEEKHQLIIYNELEMAYKNLDSINSSSWSQWNFIDANITSDMEIVNGRLIHVSRGSTKIHIESNINYNTGQNYTVFNRNRRKSINLFSDTDPKLNNSRIKLTSVSKYVDASSPCFEDNGNCEHVCLVTNITTFSKRCLCMDNYELQPDGLHCLLKTLASRTPTGGERSTTAPTPPPPPPPSSLTTV